MAEEAALAGERKDMPARLADFALRMAAGGEADNEPFTSRVCRYVVENSAEPLSLDLTAALFSISPSHLSRSLTAEYGLPFNRLLNAARMRQARRLLVETDERMSAVARKCGFRGEKYFLHVFQLAHGMTPGDFRTATRSLIAACHQTGNS